MYSNKCLGEGDWPTPNLASLNSMLVNISFHPSGYTVLLNTQIIENGQSSCLTSSEFICRVAYISDPSFVLCVGHRVEPDVGCVVCIYTTLSSVLICMLASYTRSYTVSITTSSKGAVRIYDHFSITAGGGEFGNLVPTSEMPYIWRTIVGCLSRAGKLYSRNCEFLGPCFHLHIITVERIPVLDFTMDK